MGSVKAVGDRLSRSRSAEGFLARPAKRDVLGMTAREWGGRASTLLGTCGGAALPESEAHTSTVWEGTGLGSASSSRQLPDAQTSLRGAEMDSEKRPARA